MLAPGTYRAHAVSWGLGETQTGKEQVGVLFEVLDADGNPEDRITWFGYFTEKTWERTIESLRHCGWKGNDVSDLTGLGENEVSIVVAHEDFEGKTAARVRWVNAAGGGSLSIKAPLSTERAKSFARDMQAKILGMSQGKAPASRARASGQPPEPPPIADDPTYQGDIPF